MYNSKIGAITVLNSALLLNHELGASMLYSVFSQSRKTHISPNAEGDTFCHAEKKWSWLVWDCGGEMSRLQIGLIEKDIDPDNYVCKTCMRMAQAHLTQRRADLLKAGQNLPAVSNKSIGESPA